MAATTRVGVDHDQLPIIDDPRPRVCRLTIDMDLSESSLMIAWELLMPMAVNRGYSEPSIADAILYVPRTYTTLVGRLAMQHNIKFQFIPPAMLQTSFTWMLTFGQDGILSIPAS